MQQNGIKLKTIVLVFFCGVFFYRTQCHAVAVTDGLIGYWSFDAANNNIAIDSSGSGNDGTLVNIDTTTSYVAGRLNQALYLDGVNDYVTAPSLNGAAFPATGSISLWVKSDFTSQGTSNRPIFDNYNGTRNHVFIRTYNDPSNNIQVAFQKGDGSSYKFASKLFANNNEWNHVVVCWDTVNDIGYVYMNGALIRTASITDVNWATDQQTVIFGSSPGGGAYFNGTLDDLRIYNRLLSWEEVMMLYDESFVAPTLNLSATPPTVNFNSSATITWNATDVDACTASGDWSGIKPLSGTESTGLLDSQKTYNLTCSKGAYQISRIVIIDVNMTGVIGNHPRLYLNQNKINEIKTKLSQYPYSKFWNYVKKRADSFTNETPPADISGYDDIRRFGRRVPTIAMAYLLTGDQKYFNGAKTWMDALVSYPDWDGNNDLGAAHLLQGMAVTYDWLYDSFTPGDRDIYRQKMIYHAGILYDLLVNKSIWWAREDGYLQNHNYLNVMSIAVAGMALYGEATQPGAWLAAAKNNFKTVLDYLSPDGASHEGIGYWSYGTSSLLQYFKAVEPLYGKNDVLNSNFFKNTVKYRLYASLPGYNEVVNYADSPYRDYNGPGYILRALANYFNDGYAQWLAEKVEVVRGDTAVQDWLDLIWHDETIVPLSPDNLPTNHYFDNLGIFIARTNWSDNAFWSFFKAGPPGGKLAESKGFYPGSHIQADEGHFLLWGNKQWLAIDHGYELLRRTENHNTLFFNNIGQLGEGTMWFNSTAVKNNNGTVTIPYVYTGDNYQYIVANLEKIYRTEADVRKWQRTFVSLPEGYTLIRDDVELNNPGTIKSLIHTTESLAAQIGPQSVCLNSNVSSIVEVPDKSGNNNHGTSSSGNLTLDAGIKGNALRTTGNNHLTVPSLRNIGFPSSGSFSFWVKGAFAQGFKYILDDWDSTRNHIFVRAYNNQSGIVNGLQIAFQKNDGSGYKFVTNFNVINNEWNHIVVCWDTVNDLGYVYLNGALVAQAAITDTGWVPDEEYFNIGASFLGFIDEMCLYNRVLTAQEIATLYGLGSVADSMVGMWDFETPPTPQKTFVLKSLYPDDVSYTMENHIPPPNEIRLTAESVPSCTLISAELQNKTSASIVTFIGPDCTSPNYSVQTKNSCNLVEIRTNNQVITIDFAGRSVTKEMIVVPVPDNTPAAPKGLRLK